MLLVPETPRGRGKEGKKRERGAIDKQAFEEIEW